MKCLKTLLAGAALLVSVMPAAAQDAQDLVPYRQFTLSNGLRVVVHEDHKSPKVAVSVWYGVGSMNEPEGKSGFAHLFEHLLFNGSENHDKEYFPPLQEIGASAVNGATSLDQTFYYEVVPTGGLERALWLESDRMGHLLGAITQAKLDEQRGVVQNEKRTYENRPYALASEKRAMALFPANHPYYHSVIGSMEDLNDATLDDVKSWFAQYYGAANAVVTLAGDVRFDEAKALVEKYFGSVPSGPPTSRVTAWVPTLPQDRTEVMLDNVPQTAISWSWAVPGRDTAEAPALRMAAYVLGRGKMGRLYKALVHERQIATSAGANYESSAAAGIFTIDMMLKESVDRAEAETTMGEILSEFLAEGPTAEELERSKITSYGDTVRAMESIYVKAMALSGGALFSNNPGQFAVDERRFGATTAAQVKTVAGDWLKRGSYRLAVLPFGKYASVADGADRTKLPALAASPDLSLPVIVEGRLSNGIRVLLSERPGTPTVELAMVFDAGQAAEQHMKRGLGSFTLGLMDEGTKRYDSQGLAERQAMLGARIFGYSDADTTNIALSALTRTLPESIALWADYIRNPGFRSDDLERDRALTLSSLQQSLVDPDDIAQRTFSHLLYGRDHAYGVALDGRADRVKSFTVADVAAFHERWLRPDNAVIYAAGDTNLPALTATLEKAFADWKAPALSKGTKSLDPVAAATGKRIVLVDKPSAIQSVIRVGHIMPTGLDPREFEISAMNDVLGGNFTSRLNMNLREAKGWTYGASSYIGEGRGPRVFGVATSVQTDKTAEALSEIDKEIRGLAKAKPASQEELDLLAKGQVLSLPGRFDTNNALVNYLQYVNRYDRPYDYVTTLPAKYSALRPDLITTTAASLLRPDQMTWVVVGDLSKIEQGIRALDLGSVEIWNAEGRKLR